MGSGMYRNITFMTILICEISRSCGKTNQPGLESTAVAALSQSRDICIWGWGLFSLNMFTGVFRKPGRSEQVRTLRRAAVWQEDSRQSLLHAHLKVTTTPAPLMKAMEDDSCGPL